MGKHVEYVHQCCVNIGAVCYDWVSSPPTVITVDWRRST